MIQLTEDSAQWVKHHLDEQHQRLQRDAKAAMERGRRNCLAARGETHLAQALERAAAVLRKAHAEINAPDLQSVAHTTRMGQ